MRILLRELEVHPVLFWSCQWWQGPSQGLAGLKMSIDISIWYSTALITCLGISVQFITKTVWKQTTPFLLLPRIYVLSLSILQNRSRSSLPLIPFMWVFSYFSLAPTGWLWRVYFTKAFLHPIHPTLNQLYSGTSQQSLSFTPVLSKPRFFLFCCKLCQSFVCIWPECSKSFNNYQHIKEKHFLSIIINCSCLLSAERWGAFLRYFWYSACLLTCWFCISGWVGRWVVKMLMGWLWNLHCLWEAGESSMLPFTPPEEPVQFKQQSIARTSECVWIALCG